MLELLRESALLLLFVVAAVGYVVGRLQIRGIGLGVAAVLFTGLAVGALDPALKLPEFVQQFGLAVFVYTLGVASGPGFFAAFRRRGLRDNGLALGVLGLGAAAVAAVDVLLGLRPGVAVGIFAGSLTNTPALAAVIELLHRRGASEAASADPVVGYSVAYPMGVLGVLAAILVARRLGGPGGAAPPSVSTSSEIVNRTVRVTRSEATGRPAREVVEAGGAHVIFCRMKRDGRLSLMADDAHLVVGDLVTIVGTERQVDGATRLLGEASEEKLELDRSVLDFRRVFVSNRAIAGRTLADLDLPRRYGAIVTRVRRGDVELVADRTTILELGDRVRVVCPRERMSEVAKHLGDSYAAVSEIDVVTFSVGIALGLAVGAIPIPTFVGPAFKLGTAGGPLVVGLVLGKLERTRSMVWSLPYSASLTLRQLGLVLFLAGVGTRSGDAFLGTLRHGGGLTIFLVGTTITCLVSLTTVLIGRKLLGIPTGALSGMLAGIHTQPAALAFANERHPDGSPAVGYATVFPLATIVKIVAAQILLILLTR
jgi:putative transport protein